MTIFRWVCASALACIVATPAVAQTTYPKIIAPSNTVPPAGVAYTGADDATKVVSPTNPLPVAGRQEVVVLATANTAAVAVSVYGGTYVLNQGCAAYGSMALRYRAADGTTMLTLLSKTATDSGGGTLLSLGTNTIVDVALSGTTGCNVTLARIPS